MDGTLATDVLKMALSKIFYTIKIFYNVTQDVTIV